MLRTRGLILVGLATIVVALAATLPARLVYHWFAPPGVALNGIEGSIWSGTADAVSVQGLVLRDLRWRLRPLRLFTGELRYAIAASPVSGFLDGELEVGIGRATSVYGSNIRAALPLEMFEQAFNVGGLQGNANVQFDRLEIRNRVPLAVDGVVEVRDLLAPLISRTPIGGYRAEFSTQNNGIIASVEDTDGVVDLAGSLQLAPDGSYTFLGQVVAKPAAPERLRQNMRFLGAPNARGQYELRVDGVL